MKNTENLQKLRHSAAHLLAQAVLELFPDTLPTIGPATEDGFFYDFLPSRTFKEDDLATIAARMQEIVTRKLPITHEPMAKNEARKFYTKTINSNLN